MKESSPPPEVIDLKDFLKVDIRVGKIVTAEPNPAARKPAYKLVIDFGEEFGRKCSSAQVTANYKPEDLIGRQVIAIVNFPPKVVGSTKSEVLVLAAVCTERGTVLLRPDVEVKVGVRIA